MSKVQNREEEHMHHRRMKVLGMARAELCFLSLLGMARAELCFLSCGYKGKKRSNLISTKTLIVEKF